jgi:hypothetical protein
VSSSFLTARYYVLDFARVYPPQAPFHSSPGGGEYAKLLRPELLSKRATRMGSDRPDGARPVPLSSDAFNARFGKDNAAGKWMSFFFHIPFFFACVLCFRLACSLTGSA